jgi:hypothetical protein
MFTRARHWSLSCVRSIQFTVSHSISLRTILKLYSHLPPGLPNISLQDIWTKYTLHFTSPCAVYIPHPSHLPWCYITLIKFSEEYKSISSPLCSFLHPLTIFSLYYFLQRYVFVKTYEIQFELYIRRPGTKIKFGPQKAVKTPEPNIIELIIEFWRWSVYSHKYCFPSCLILMYLLDCVYCLFKTEFYGQKFFCHSHHTV